MEDPFMVAFRVVRCDCQDGVFVVFCHPCGFRDPVGSGVLKNAQRVNPEIAVAEVPGCDDGVVESAGEEGVLSDIICVRFSRL
jgi:hypothetical protein